MVIVIRELRDLSKMLRALERHLRDEVVPQIAVFLGPKVVGAIQARIYASDFGDSYQRAGANAAANSEYTLYGDEEDNLRYEEGGPNESDSRVRRSVYHQDDDMFGKAIRGLSTKPLMETNQYVGAFHFFFERHGDRWTIGVENEVGQKEVDDDPANPLPLWEVQEFGAGNTPPRPHIGPGMRDAVRENRREVEAILKREVLMFFQHNVQVEVAKT